jgi:hypothetical protein
MNSDKDRKTRGIKESATTETNSSVLYKPKELRYRVVDRLSVAVMVVWLSVNSLSYRLFY